MSTCKKCQGERYRGTNITMRIEGREQRMYIRCECLDGPRGEDSTIEFTVPTGKYCGVPGCGRPQFECASGVSCSNGHGGAPSIDADEEDPA